jgi:hypothetical protein
MQFAIAICSLTILRYYFTTVQYTIYFALHHSLTACLLKVWLTLPKYVMMLQIPYRLHEWPASLSHGMSTLNSTLSPSCSSPVSLRPAAVLLTKLINMTCKLCCSFWVTVVYSETVSPDKEAQHMKTWYGLGYGLWPWVVQARMLDSHDVIMALVPLVEDPPWQRKCMRSNKIVVTSKL